MTGGETMFRLDGKAALVTGASGGIGAAIARALHAQGARWCCPARGGTRWRHWPRTRRRAHVCPADLRDAAEPDALIEAAEQPPGRCTSWSTTPGMTRDMLALRMSDQDWQAVLDIDLSAPFRLARAALRGMLRRRAGRIINISSIVGATGNAGQANYAAAKAGLVGMSKSLAQEVASRGITVNVVAPGFVETAMTESLAEAQKSQTRRANPAGPPRPAGGHRRRRGLSGVG